LGSEEKKMAEQGVETIHEKSDLKGNQKRKRRGEASGEGKVTSKKTKIRVALGGDVPDAGKGREDALRPRTEKETGENGHGGQRKRGRKWEKLLEN